jgi:hypothetical protein
MMRSHAARQQVVMRGFNRPVRMALEAVNFHGRIGMAAGAEVFLAADSWRIRRIADVTVYAFIQAVLFGTNAFVYGLVALMQDVLHVVLAHFLDGFHAALGFAETCLCLRNDRQDRVTC